MYVKIIFATKYTFNIEFFFRLTLKLCPPSEISALRKLKQKYLIEFY